MTNVGEDSRPAPGAAGRPARARSGKPPKARWPRWAALVLALAAGAGFVWSDRIVHEIPPGHGGVLWLRLFGGTVDEPALPEGVHLTFPWDSVILYDIRYRTVHREVAAVTRDGLEVGLTVSYRYRPAAETLGLLHRRVGPQFERVLVRASMDAALREVVADYSAAALHSDSRGTVSRRVMAALSEDLRRGSLSAGQGEGRSMVDLEDFLIRSYTLPPSVVSAVEHKNKMLQVVEEWDYRLRREVAESHRKALEARGIAAFQAELAEHEDLDGYLRLRGVQAMEVLATSPNSKLIVTGAGGRRPPVIVNLPPSPPAEAAGRQEEQATQVAAVAPSRRLSGDEDKMADAAEETAAEAPEVPLLARVRGLWGRFIKKVGHWTGLGGG